MAEVTTRPQKASGPASPKPDQDLVDPLKQIQGWVGALTAASLLVAIGFISRISREQFLGVSPGAWDVSTLSLSAGRCFVDSVIIPIDFLWGVILGLLVNHPYRTAAVALALLSLIVAGWYIRDLWWNVKAFRCSLLCLVCLSLIFVLLAYELPTVPLVNWLSAPLPQVPCDLSGQSNQLTATGCVTRTAQVLAASKMHDDFDNTQWGPLFNFEMTSDQARSTIIRHYSVAVLICVFSWLWFLFSLPFHRSNGKDQFFSVASTAVFLILALETGFAPYMYGKVIQSTDFPDAEVSFKEVQAKPGAKEALPRNAQETIITDDFVVVSRGDKTISLVLRKPDVQRPEVFKIREVSLDRVLFIRFLGSVDPVTITLTKQIPLKVKPKEVSK